MYLKRKFLFFWLGLLAFITLFYDQKLGANVLIFCAVAWLLMVYSEGGFRAYRNDKGFWWLTGAVAVAGGAFSFYCDPGSFLVLLLSFYVLGVYLSEKRFQPLLYPLLLAYSLGSFIVRVFFFSRWIPRKNHGDDPPPVDGYVNTSADSTSHQNGGWLKTWGIPIAIAGLFLLIYMSSSTLFSDVLRRLIPNLDFGTLIFLGVLGFYLLFNFMYLLPMIQFYSWNDAIKRRELTGTLRPVSVTHQKAGVLTLSLLIGLLSVFLIVYSYELYQGIHAARLSKAVHEQVNSIILSIVMAVAVIILYIQPAASTQGNDKEKKKPLIIRLAYAWIILNGVLVISASLHDSAYIGRYGLTEQRIGVFIFLGLSLVGLYFTYRKIRYGRSVNYLVSIMFKVFLTTLVLNSVVNWSAVITRYNLTYVDKPDLNYLLLLDYNGHIIVPYLRQSPAYKDDSAMIRRVQNKLDWDGSENVNTSAISKTWYYEYELRRLKSKGVVR